MKYPPQFKVGFFSNNPPLYILQPELKSLKEGRSKVITAPEPKPKQ